MTEYPAWVMTGGERRAFDAGRVAGYNEGRDNERALAAASLPPDAENPERLTTRQIVAGGRSSEAWVAAEDHDRAVAAAFAAGRAAASPDPPDMTNMCEGESPDHKPGITPAASPDERLREAARHLREKADQLRPSDSFPESAAFQNFRGWLGAADELDRLAAADRETPDEAEGQKITHGRHCTCTPCAVEDWTNPALAPCGMHGKGCPQEYQPLGPAGSFTPPAAATDFPTLAALAAADREKPDEDQT